MSRAKANARLLLYVLAIILTIFSMFFALNPPGTFIGLVVVEIPPVLTIAFLITLMLTEPRQK